MAKKKADGKANKIPRQKSLPGMGDAKNVSEESVVVNSEA